MGEGRVDLGITGGDQVAEHEANSPATEESGVVEVLDLGFGRCKLQVQVPEKGAIKDARDLVGKNVVTSFVGLTERYFAKLEELGREVVNGDADLQRTEVEVGSGKGEVPVRAKLKTKIKYVGGSVEAACALGVADGIVDLVGKVHLAPILGKHLTNHVSRIRRNNESSRSESHRHSRRKHSRTHKVQTPLKPSPRRPNYRTNKRRHRYPPFTLFPFP